LTVAVSQADLVSRVRAEYLEMPGLRLTEDQAQRLFGLSALVCQPVLGSLLESGFLWRSPTGIFTLAPR
jgi:hypothetical protein